MSPEELKEAIQEFKKLYKEEFGIELSIDDTTEKAKGILQLFNCLLLDKEV